MMEPDVNAWRRQQRAALPNSRQAVPQEDRQRAAAIIALETIFPQTYDMPMDVVPTESNDRRNHDA